LTLVAKTSKRSQALPRSHDLT